MGLIAVPLALIAIPAFYLGYLAAGHLGLLSRIEQRHFDRITRRKRLAREKARKAYRHTMRARRR